MTVFDIDDLIMSVNGTLITDLAQGSSITVSSVEPKLTPHYGLQGAVGVARNGVKAKQVSFQVMSNSPNAKMLTDLAERGAFFSFNYVNMNDNGRRYSHSKCFIEEVPDEVVGGEIGETEVVITMPLGA